MALEPSVMTFGDGRYTTASHGSAVPGRVSAAAMSEAGDVVEEDFS